MKMNKQMKSIARASAQKLLEAAVRANPGADIPQTCLMIADRLETVE